MKIETRGFKVKLKPGSLEKVRAWAAMFNERKEEALATLRDEGVILETVFLDQTPEGDFLFAIMKAGNFARAKEALESSIHEIDAYHQNFKRETWENHQRLELLVDLDRIFEIK